MTKQKSISSIEQILVLIFFFIFLKLKKLLRFSRLIPSIWSQFPGTAKVYRWWVIFEMETCQFTMVQFFRNRPLWPLCHYIFRRNGIFVKKILKSLFETIIFYLIQISLLTTYVFLPHRGSRIKWMVSTYYSNLYDIIYYPWLTK